MEKAILRGSMLLPVGSIDVRQVRRALTHKVYAMGSEEPTIVRAYREGGDYISVPRQYGLDLCFLTGLQYEDQTTYGQPISFPRVPVPRDYQVPVLDELERKSAGFYDFVFRARTGFGKTISVLILASRLGRSTLILVDQDNLKDQWIEALGQHFGVPQKDVGIIQGKVCDYEGKPVTIGMLQTLSQKTMPPEVYRYFGFLGVDECHGAGAPTFSKVLMDFHATTRIGISATPKRRDGLQPLLNNNLGKIRVYVSDEHARSSVYIAKSQTTYSWYANTSPKIGRFLAEVSEDAGRNRLVADSAVFLHDSGRDTLVLSDRIQQLHHLQNLCYYLGVPDEDMGMYTGDKYEYAYVKQETPPRRPPHWERGTKYTPVELKLISKTRSKADRLYTKENASLIFATYQMFSKGVDVPRLSGGVDATPRSLAEQAQGRILRIEKGKPHPIWITIEDSTNYRSLHQLAGRVADYRTNNAAIFHLHEDGSTEPCLPDELIIDLRERVETLRSMRIERTSDGRNMLVSPASRRQSAIEAVNAIRQRTRHPEPSRTVSSPRAPSVKSTTRILTTPSSPSRSPSPRRRVP